MKKKIWKLAISMVLTAVILYGCSDKKPDSSESDTIDNEVAGVGVVIAADSEATEGAADNSSQEEASEAGSGKEDEEGGVGSSSQEGTTEAAGDKVEKEEEDGSSQEDTSEAAANKIDNQEDMLVGGLDAISEEGSYDPKFELFMEAETEAITAGKVRVENSKQGFTGTGYLVGIENPGDTVTFQVSVPGSGAYDLNFISASYSGYKENNVLIDGETIGVAKVEGTDFTNSVLERIYLTVGDHEIQMTKNWGWVYLDALKVTASQPADETIYEVSAELVDKKATDRTKRLMQYLVDVYGDYVISGQYGDLGIDGKEFKAIHQLTGEYPAMLGLDFIEYTPSRVAHGSFGKDVEYARKFDKEGGIITFAWHWNAPEPYLMNTKEQPWWSGFYTRATNINLKKIMDGEDEEGYKLLLRDMDAIAEELKKLQAAEIPVLWRPLHEASGGWFWWGASGAEAYIELYQLLFDRLTNYHDLHNLIWVWNGQNKDWYPGDEYVDIVGTDIYPGERVYTSQVAKFNELVDWMGDSRKLIALTENGCLFDPDLAFRDNAKWAYFGTWEREFVTMNDTFTLSEQYTEKAMVKKVYTHDKVLTLDELPDLKTYGQ